MKIVTLIARILLGLVFVVFGANLVHTFLPAPMPTGVAGQLLGGLYVSHFLVLIGLVQFIGGILLLAGQFVTLGLVILGPVIVCIDFFHLSVAHSGIPLAGVVTILWILVALAHKHHLAGIFSRTA
jgi:putative oxidoreductase